MLGLDLGLGLVLGFELVFRLGLGLRLVMTVQFMTVQILTLQIKTGNHGTAAPYSLAHVYCRQSAGWIKVPFGVEVHLGSDHIVLDGNPAPIIRGTAAPKFRPVSIVAKCRHGSKCHLVRRSVSVQVTLC